MEVSEKRMKLAQMCYRQSEHCARCVFYNPHAEDCTMDLEGAPDEMIYKWYAMAFPFPKTEKETKEAQRVFSTGAKRDDATGKGRFDLLPWGAIWEVAKHSQRGADHYGSHNVDKGIPTSCLLDSCIRHLCKHLMGYTDEPHLVAAAWNALWAVQMCITHPELVDTPWREDGEK